MTSPPPLLNERTFELPLTKIIVAILMVESTVFRKLCKTSQLLHEQILWKQPPKHIHQIQKYMHETALNIMTLLFF